MNRTIRSLAACALALLAAPAAHAQLGAASGPAGGAATGGPPAGRGQGRRPGGRFGGFFGGANDPRPRYFLSLSNSFVLESEVLVAPGGPSMRGPRALFDSRSKAS